MITPKTSMRPLFWNRIQVPVEQPKLQRSQAVCTDDVSDIISISQQQPQPEINAQLQSPPQPTNLNSSVATKKKTLWENLEEMRVKDEELDEFCQLFRRTVTTSSRTFSRNPTQKTKETISLLDPKRAHTINILITSRHLSIKDIKNTVYNLNMSIIDVETLKQIHEIAGTEDELQTIQTFLNGQDHGEIGKAEQFIYELSQIDSFNDRFKCIMFEVSAAEQIQAIESKLDNFKHMCEVLISSESIQQILSIILAYGNYMNGGNRDRGQADGFGLEILPKLRDVKSATSSVTLLHFIVQTYIRNHIPSGIVSFDEVKEPLPGSSDLEQASIVVFDDIDQDLKNLDKQIESCQQCCERVEGQHQEPFRSHMKIVFSKISKEYQDQRENLQDCIQIFEETREFFCWNSKTQQPVKEFFNCWITFCRDFHSIFKSEIRKKIKLELERARAKVNADKEARTKDVKTSKASPSGLKARLGKKGLFNNLVNSFT